MTEEDKKQLSTFEARLRHLLYKYDQLKQTNEKLRQEKQNAEEEITRLQTRCATLESDYANLKTARIISISDNEMRNTKQRLSQLVREVDKCIALLNG